MSGEGNTVVYGFSSEGYGIIGAGGNIGILGYYADIRYQNDAYLGTQSVAGDFYNDVHGKITKFGGGFQIDVPRDPGDSLVLTA